MHGKARRFLMLFSIAGWRSVAKVASMFAGVLIASIGIMKRSSVLKVERPSPVKHLFGIASATTKVGFYRELMPKTSNLIQLSPTETQLDPTPLPLPLPLKIILIQRQSRRSGRSYLNLGASSNSARGSTRRRSPCGKNSIPMTGTGCERA